MEQFQVTMQGFDICLIYSLLYPIFAIISVHQEYESAIFLVLL